MSQTSFETIAKAGSVPPIDLMRLEQMDYVLCFLCGDWVSTKETLIVTGQCDSRVHICTKHLENSLDELPLHQAV